MNNHTQNTGQKGDNNAYQKPASRNRRAEDGSGGSAVNIDHKNKMEELKDTYTNSSKWAEWQDKVFDSGEVPDPESISAWLPMMKITEALCGPTNLTLRHYLIMAANKRSFIHNAREAFDALHYNGYWLEGASYAEYCAKGMAWAREVYGEEDFGFEPILDNYADLTAPDGTIPIPETRASLKLLSQKQDPNSLPSFISNPSYFCRRWWDDQGRAAGYILMNVNDIRPTNPTNLHTWPEFGMVAVWTLKDGWILRPPAYLGWPDRQRQLLDERRHLALPPRSIDAEWRFLPALTRREFKMMKSGDLRFTWVSGKFKKASRTVRMTSDKITITDEWGPLGGEMTREINIY